jgi:hypothetical protein
MGVGLITLAVIYIGLIIANQDTNRLTRQKGLYKVNSLLIMALSIQGNYFFINHSGFFFW